MTEEVVLRRDALAWKHEKRMSWKQQKAVPRHVKSPRPGIGHPRLSEEVIYDARLPAFHDDVQFVAMLGQRQWLRAASALV